MFGVRPCMGDIDPDSSKSFDRKIDKIIQKCAYAFEKAGEYTKSILSKYYATFSNYSATYGMPRGPLMKNLRNEIIEKINKIDKKEDDL